MFQKEKIFGAEQVNGVSIARWSQHLKKSFSSFAFLTVVAYYLTDHGSER